MGTFLPIKYLIEEGKNHLVLFLPFFSLPFLFQELGTNAVPELPVEQMVEFSVTLTDQEYTAELSDPNSPEYQQLAAKFQLQVGMFRECKNPEFVPWLRFILWNYLHHKIGLESTALTLNRSFLFSQDLHVSFMCGISLSPHLSHLFTHEAIKPTSLTSVEASYNWWTE